MTLYRFQIDSHLPAYAVLDRVQALMREAPKFRQLLIEALAGGPDGTRPFVGKVDGSQFTCYRHIHYRNSFLPRIKGTVQPSPSGSTIDVRMSLYPSVALAMGFWFGAVGLGTAAALLRQGGTPVIVPLGLFVFGLAMTLCGFYPEAVKARRLLEARLGKSGGAPTRLTGAARVPTGSQN
jgi:hypothetical protein